MAQVFKNIFWGILLCSSACSSSGAETAGRTTAAQRDSSTIVPDGMAVFRKYCVTCHGADGKLGLYSAKDLGESTLSRDERINIITHGKNLMTPFGTILSPAEIEAVAEYTLSFKKKADEK